MRFALLVCTVAIFLADPLAHAAPDPGLFVAVGYGGRRITSRDGLVWENEQRWSDEAKDDDNALFDVAYGAGRFVAVGGGAKIGHILSTRDGREWRPLAEVRGRVATIVFGQGRFVAGHEAGLLSSTDGETFHPGQRLEWKGSVHPRRSACGDTEAGYRFIVIGDIDLAVEKTRVHWRAATADGQRWDHAALETAAARDIAYGAGHFVVVGPGGLIESSHDGQTWERHPAAPDEDFSRIVWTGTRFVVSGGRTAWTSPDGLTWARAETRVPGDIVWAREGQLALAFAWGGDIHLSRDLVQWQKLTLPAGPSLQSVAHGPAAAPP